MNARARQGGVYLEPGELAELAQAAVAAGSAAGLHPRALLLREMALALARLAEEPFGCLLLPAADADAAEAARHYLLRHGQGREAEAGDPDPPDPFVAPASAPRIRHPA